LENDKDSIVSKELTTTSTVDDDLVIAGFINKEMTIPTQSAAIIAE